MALTENAGDLPAPRPPHRFWQFLTRLFTWAEAEISYVKGLTLFGLVSTLLVAYFQNLSAYQSKVSAQAQADITAATQAFADASSALSTPLNLQRALILSYHNAITANTDGDNAAYDTVSARNLYKAYTDAYSSLSQNYNLLARKMELYVDWPSNLYRDPTAEGEPTSDNIDMSRLNAYGFDCETNMPSFQKDAKQDLSQITLTNPQNNPPALTIDWYSAKHNVLAIETCFEITHESMTPVLQWASGSPVDPAKKTAFIERTFNVFQLRASNQVLRLNAFMSLAMFDIDKIRIKYRPNGFICSLPGVSGILSLFGHCTPIHTATP